MINLKGKGWLRMEKMNTDYKQCNELEKFRLNFSTEILKP